MMVLVECFFKVNFKIWKNVDIPGETFIPDNLHLLFRVIKISCSERKTRTMFPLSENS